MTVSHVVVPWPLLLCGFSYDQPRTGVWVSRSGIKVIAYGKHGAPFGRARLIWLHLATLAAESGPTVQVSLAELAAQYGGKVPHGVAPQARRESVASLQAGIANRIDCAIGALSAVR